MHFLAALATVLPLVASLAIPNSETSQNSSIILLKRQQTGFQSHQCKIVGSGPNYCRTCDSTSCKSIKTLTVGSTYGFDCVCRSGECLDGFCGWDYLVADGCFVWAERTDDNCPTAGKNGLTECAFCSI